MVVGVGEGVERRDLLCDPTTTNEGTGEGRVKTMDGMEKDEKKECVYSYLLFISIKESKT